MMIALASPILDESGSPIRRSSSPRELAMLQRMTAPKQRNIDASYDAASDSDEYSKYWANADQYDANAANRRDVRRKLVSRSRYEVGNNGYSDGIAQTYATDVVGVGPKLRMMTASVGFNQMVEAEWLLWCQAVQLRRKLWCLAHAKHQDGEGFAIARTNPNLAYDIKLDVRLYETEQVQTPYAAWQDAGLSGIIDGIHFDEYGNPETYDVLQQHPGSSTFNVLSFVADSIEARYVMHWYKLRRPGQHRAVPECTSTLNTGAAGRRFREATIAAAESAADFTTLIKTTLSPDEVEAVSPMSTMDIQKRMLTALPMGYDAFQMKAEHPTATYESFSKAQINEQARPKSMPYNKAACDSSSYNYASGRLDHQTYYASLDVDREDANDLVLEPLFALWFDEAIRVFGWLGGNARAIGLRAKLHSWDWPKHRVADVAVEAQANDVNLKNGTTSLSKIASDDGEDFQDRVIELAKDFGLETDSMRQVLLNQLFPVAMKNIADVYGIAVRAGMITPQIEDEVSLRKMLGLPAVSKAVTDTWKNDGGTRRPLTLTTPDLIEEATTAAGDSGLPADQAPPSDQVPLADQSSGGPPPKN